MKTLNDVMCTGYRDPYVANVTIPLKQCVPRVLKLASNIQNKSKIRLHKYQRDCSINKNYKALFRVYMDHPSYLVMYLPYMSQCQNSSNFERSKRKNTSSMK